MLDDIFLLFPVLYSGPLSEAKVIFPVGEFKLYAEIHEEAGAYSPFIINPKFSTVLPDEDDYNAANVDELLKQYSEIGDQARISQLLQADASIRAKACWFNVTCALGEKANVDPELMDEKEKEEFKNLMRDLTHANTDALNSAKDNMEFSSGIYKIIPC